MSTKPRVRGPAGAQWFTAQQRAAVPLRVGAHGVPSLRGQFDATRSGRRLRGWQPSEQDINTILANGGRPLLKRARDLGRNNPYGRAARQAWKSALVGCGITPSLRVSDGLKAEAEEAFLAWTDEADADGTRDYYGMMALGAAHLCEAGECFYRFRPRFSADRLSVPLQLQFLPAEMLPWELNQTTASGNEIRLGVEFDRIGRRVAYWFHRRHPGDGVTQRVDPELYSRVPAEEVVHLYDPDDTQIRGFTRFAAAMIRLRLLDDTDDALAERARLAAMFVGFITTPSIEDEPLPASDATDEQRAGDRHQAENGPPLAPLEPGTFQQLQPGESVQWSQPPDVGGSYEPFQYRSLLAISVATGVPYPLLTGDLRQVNYSSIRSGMIEFHRQVEQLQHHVLIFQLCRAVWLRWLDAAMLAGRLAVPERDLARARMPEHLPPPFPWVDPESDIKAEILEIRAGLKSRTMAIAQRGKDRAALDAEIRAEREAAAGLSFPELEKAPAGAGAPPREGGGQQQPKQAA
jgi:lambda family phage portal protein